MTCTKSVNQSISGRPCTSVPLSDISINYVPCVLTCLALGSVLPKFDLLDYEIISISIILEDTDAPSSPERSMLCIGDE